MTPSASEKQNQHFSKENAEIKEFCSLEVFLDYWRQEGKGRVGQGFDVYLLDNRNRTQKWDE